MNEESRYVVRELVNDGIYSLKVKEEIFPTYSLKRYYSEVLAKRDEEGPLSEIARYLPFIYIEGDDFGRSEEYSVSLQTTSFGSLDLTEYQAFQTATELGYQTAEGFDNVIKKYEKGEYEHYTVIFDSDNLEAKDGE